VRRCLVAERTAPADARTRCLRVVACGYDIADVCARARLRRPVAQRVRDGEPYPGVSRRLV
jgi:hypothetical protein